MKPKSGIETQHTPGPWKVIENPRSSLTCFVTQDIRKTTSLTIAEVPMDLTASPSNARLISAAPDLLEACEFLVEKVAALTTRGGDLTEDDVEEYEKARLLVNKLKTP